MTGLLKAKEPFRFSTRLHLFELTGLRASSLDQLLTLIKDVPGSCIYHHTHRFLQQHQIFSPEPPNDFAYWIGEALGEDVLAEQLASIDIVQFSSIRGLRDKIVATIENYIKKNARTKNLQAPEGQEFHFIKSLSFVVPTRYEATDLKEFRDILEKITIDSIYFHIFESRLRIEKKTNDFSLWIEMSLENKELADKISGLDPYTQTMENLRHRIIQIIERS